MVIEVHLPQCGMGMQDGKILRWYVTEGETVARGQAICELEAAKAVMDVEAPASGILVRILVPAEETARVRDVIAVIQEVAGDAAA